MIGTGKEYADALFSLTEELGTTEGALSDARAVKEVLSQNPEYIKLLDTPALPVSEKLSLIDEAFGTVDGSLKNLIMMLCEKHSVYFFPKIAKEYELCYNEARGILTAEAISAQALSEDERVRLVGRLEEITGKKIILTERIDKSLLGGLVVRYGTRQLDGSLKTRLSAIEKSLKSTIV